MADNPFAQYATQPAAAANPFAQFAAAPTSSEIPGARQSFGEALGTAVTNIPESALKFGTGVVNMVTSPLQTAGGVLDIAAGAVQNVLPQPIVDFVNSLHNPEAAKRAVDLANHVGGEYKTHFGTLDGFKHYLATDPVGLVGDISMLLSGGATAAAKTANIASKAPAAVLSGLMQGGRVANIAEAVAPAMAAARPVANALNKAVPVLNQMTNFTNPVSLFVNPITAQGADITGKAAKSLAKGAYSAIEPYIPGGGAAIKARAYMDALNNDPAKISAAITMLEKGTPIEEVASTLQSSGLASLASTAQNASTVVKDLYLARANAVKQEQANKLAGAKTNVNALQQGNLPASTEPANLPRTALNATLTAEQATLAQQQAARAQQLTAEQQAAKAALEQQQAEHVASVQNPSQMEVGQTLTGERKALEESARKNIVTPAYNAAFEKATEPFSFAPVEAKAKQLEADVSTRLNPQIAPYTSEVLKLFGSKAPKVEKGAPPGEVVPAMVTLNDADKLVKAINSDLASIRGSMDSASNMTRKNLLELKSSAETAIAAGVSPEANQLYKTARTLHRTQVVEPFMKGWVANLEREGATGTQILAPSAVTKKILGSEEDAIRAVAAFGESPKALQAIKNGVEGAYRNDVVIGKTSHAKWMADHQFELAALDKAGLGLTNQLNKIGAKSQSLENVGLGINEATKAIPAKVKAEFAMQESELKKISTQLGHENTVDLRKSLVGNEAVMNKALARMPEPAKAALARGVMEDALAQSNGNQILKHLNDNETTILSALKAANPKMGATIFADAKKGAEVQALIEETAKKVSATPAESAQHLADLTQDLPVVRKVVDQVKTELAHEENFKKLAQEGQRAGGGAYGLASEAAGKPIASLSHAMTIYNVITNRLKGGLDKKLTAEIANELINSPEAAAAIARAQAKTQGKIEAATAPTMLNRLKAVDYSALKPSRRTVLNVNQLVPNEETRNSLNTYSMIP